MARPKSNGEKKLSQKEMVRTALQEVGSNAKPQELQSHIKSKFNVDLPPNTISNYTSILKREAGAPTGRGRGRPPAAALQVEDFETIRKLVTRLGAAQVKRLVDVVA